MTRATRIAVGALLAVLLAGAVHAAPNPDHGKIELVRDTWGVAHVFSDTDAGAMFGLGYANAEDRAFQMYYGLRIMQGRLAEILGDRPEFQGRGGSRTDAVAHDRKARSMGWARAAGKAADQLDPEIRGLLEAFSEGVNAYMEETSDSRHYLFGETGLEPEPWTPAACLLSWWHIAQFFAGDGLGDETDREAAMKDPNRRHRSLRRPTDATAAVITAEDLDPAWLKRVRRFAEEHGIPTSQELSAMADGPKMSHAWVVGGKKSTTGSAILHSDPQTPVRNPALWYEFHAQGETFNMRGIGAPGCPTPLIGYTTEIAWGLTALGADQADLFVLKTDPERPDQYELDGEWRDMEVREETIKVKGGETQSITVRETHFGPVMTKFAGRAGVREVALKRVPMATTERETVAAIFGMVRAKNTAEVLEASRGWLFPSANCVIGDKEGNIGFTLVAGLPIRSRNALDWGSVAHDGSTTADDWQGMIPGDIMPHILNPKRGWIGSGNHLSIVPEYPLPLGIGVGGGGHTDRSTRLYERLLEKDKFSPEDVLDIHYDMVHAQKRDIVMLGLHLRDTAEGALSDEARKALEYLKPWYDKGARSDMNVAGTELVNAMNVNFRDMTTPLARPFGGGASGLSWWLRTVKERLEADAKASLEDDEIAFINTTLGGAWRGRAQAWGDDPAGWLEKAREEARDRKIGYFVSLDGFPSLDPEKDLTTPQLSIIDGGTIFSQGGQSYSMFVPLHDVDSAKSILPQGHREEPGHRFHSSTYDLWAKGEMHPAPLSRRAVDKIAAETRKLSK